MTTTRSSHGRDGPEAGDCDHGVRRDDAVNGGMIPVPEIQRSPALSDTFVGTRPADVPGFVVAQFAGAFAATPLFPVLVLALPQTTERVVIPRSQTVD